MAEKTAVEGATMAAVDEKDIATETMDGGVIDEKPEELTRFGKFCQRHGINSNLIMLKITLFVMYGGEYLVGVYDCASFRVYRAPGIQEHMQRVFLKHVLLRKMFCVRLAKHGALARHGEYEASRLFGSLQIHMHRDSDRYMMRPGIFIIAMPLSLPCVLICATPVFACDKHGARRASPMDIPDCVSARVVVSVSCQRNV